MTGRHAENPSLRALLSEADWTYEALARAVKALGAENGMRLRYDRTSVAHWLAGSVPRSPARRLIAEAFARRLGRPVTPVDLGMGLGEHPAGTVPEQGHGLEPVLEATSGAVDHLARLCALDADPARRGRVQESVYTVGGLDVSAWPAPGNGRPARPAACGKAGSDDGDAREERRSETLRAAAEFFRRQGELGGRHARTALVVYLHDDVLPGLHAHGGQGGRDGPGGAGGSGRLMAEAAQLVHVLARMYADDVKHGAAQHYYRAAVHLAAEAGDPTAYAVVLRGTGGHALDLGHVRAALRLSEAAARAAPEDAPPGVHASLQAQLALALARTGARERATACLRRAEEEQARAGTDGPPDDGPPPLHAFSRAALLFQKGRTLAALGDTAGALAALRLSLEVCPPAAHRSRALTQVEIARLLLRRGHLEEACTAWHRFLDDYFQLRSGYADRALTELRTELRVHAGRRPVPGLLQRADAAARRR